MRADTSKRHRFFDAIRRDGLFQSAACLFGVVAILYTLGCWTPPPQQVADPVFDPAGGTFTASAKVTISCGTLGASIYYTTDGSDPTTSSTLYSGPIYTQTATIRALAVKAGMLPSKVVSASFTITDTDKVTGVSDAAGMLTVNAEVLKEPATVHVTDTDNNPIEGVTTIILQVGDQVIISFSKPGYFPIATLINASDIGSGKTASKAVIIASGLAQGAGAQGDPALQQSRDSLSQFVQHLVIGGFSQVIQEIKILSAGVGAMKLLSSDTIAWHQPASLPPGFVYLGTTSLRDVQSILSVAGVSTLFIPEGTVTKVISVVTFGGTILIDVVGMAGVDLDKQYDWYAFIVGTPIIFCLPHIQQTVATPSLTPNGGTFTDWVDVEITCGTAGATIRYTTNGSTPTSSSGTIYTGPVHLTATTTIKAIAYKSGMTDSQVVSATYTKRVPQTNLVFTVKHRFLTGTHYSTRIGGISLSPDGSRLGVAFWGDTSADPIREYSTTDYSCLLYTSPSPRDS